MPTYTRAQFLQLSAILAGAGPVLSRLAGRNSGAAAQNPSGPAYGDQAAQNPTTPVKGSGIEADLIVTNAVVYTIDPAMPRAEAFAVKHGRFLAVGSNDDIRNLAGARTHRLDAQRMTVVPGFIDTHCHPSGVNELFEVNANVRTMAELQANLRAKAAKTPSFRPRCLT